TQRLDQRGEILRRQPCAWRTGHLVATVAPCGLWPLVGRKLFSPGQRGTGFGPIRGARLALLAPALLPDTTDPLVLRPYTTDIRRGNDARQAARTPDDRTSAPSHEHLVGDSPGTTDQSGAIPTRANQTAVLPASQCSGTTRSRKNAQGTTAIRGHRCRPHQILYPPIANLI